MRLYLVSVWSYIEIISQRNEIFLIFALLALKILQSSPIQTEANIDSQ